MKGILTAARDLFNHIVAIEEINERNMELKNLMSFMEQTFGMSVLKNEKENIEVFELYRDISLARTSKNEE